MGDWTAILIDTNIFIKTNYNFDGGHLERLKNFRHRPEKIVFDDIIYGEIVSNFSKHLLEKSQALKKANKEAWSAKLIDLSHKNFIETLYVNEEEALEKARDSLDSYIQECDATQIDTHDYSDVEKLINDYFLAEPPFGIREIKKYEFPDALCLNSVHAWAVEEDQRVVLVSEDKGWTEYAALYEDRLKVVKNISEALNVFQEFDSREFYTNLVRSKWLEVCNEVESAIGQAVFSEIAEGSVEAEASSYLHFEAEIEDAVVDELDFIENDTGLEVNLVEAPETGFGGDFYISVMANVKYTVSAIFSFNVYDSVDKDVISLGGFFEEVELNDEVEVIVCFNYEDDSLVFCNAEVSGLPRSIYFGDVEPNYHE